jgi:tRNA pseudouridine32 synthase / 23S rRNA pseudouridine746 synthase
MKTFSIKASQYFSQSFKLGELLHSVTKLDFVELSSAAAKGAVWVQKNAKGKITRARSLHVTLAPEDVISFYYDPYVLALPEVMSAEAIFDSSHYGVWVKESGVLSQGGQSGDHTSLLRYVEKIKKKDVFLVHRLDRETTGLMVVAYHSQGAAKLSDLFQNNKIAKTYQAIVKGALPEGETGAITFSLDGKKATTHFKVLATKNSQSLLELTIETGRFHQIRRHLDMIGHPVMGDPRYGKGNKNKEGLKLLAWSLSFVDPWDRQSRLFTLPSGRELRLQD